MTMQQNSSRKFDTFAFIEYLSSGRTDVKLENQTTVVI